MTALAESLEAWEPITSQDGVELCLYTFPGGGKTVIVQDVGCQHYKIQLFPTAPNELSISIAAELSDRSPGRMANFTHDLSLLIGPDDCLRISDDGLLTVMARQNGASTLNLQFGLTLQLSTSYVVPMRNAIALARQLANTFQ
ncbi:hypothetical protein [Comamonas testosteroni]|jgi:hypothetical protein|uniref:hypothetical protein n=1 Tax=Comamonas testosteroni TaxID=285 RepID=UPI0026ECD1FB|nr:hypothetical protein [Comamonas testosteroni]